MYTNMYKNTIFQDIQIHIYPRKNLLEEFKCFLCPKWDFEQLNEKTQQINND